MTTKKKIGPETKAEQNSVKGGTSDHSCREWWPSVRGQVHTAPRHGCGPPARRITFALSAESEASAGEYIYDIWVRKDFLNKKGERDNYIKDE